MAGTSSSHSYQKSNSNPIFDEEHWIVHIRRVLDEDLEQESNDIPITIFNVPRTLKLTSPESYIPQQVALGPYHHCRPELYEMERYKLDAAKRFQRQLHGLKFHILVDHLTEFEPNLRACYHNYLSFSGETLAWMMAVDSCFLLEFLQILVVKEENLVRTGRKSGHDAVLRDMIMLENQIPLFSLRKTLEFKLGGSVDNADEMFDKMLMRFCTEVLPFKLIEELWSFDQVVKCAHLLDLLYHFIVPETLEGSSEIASEEETDKNDDQKISFQKIVSKLRTGPVILIRRLVISKPVKFLFRIVSVLPGMIMIKQMEYFCFSQEKGEENKQETENKHPLMEEIDIPSVAELSRAGIQFSPTKEGILGINFDPKTAVFRLPTVTLDVNTEVTLRNLVAYEACSASGPLIFTRYTELMNGIIDTGDDAKVLREQGIVLNHLKSDEDVANLWNLMSKSIRLTKVPFLDRVIEDVNSYYKGRWRVRIGNLLRRHVFGSWQCMTFLAAILLLFFMSLQTFCSLFSCFRLFFLHKRMK